MIEQKGFKPKKPYCIVCGEYFPRQKGEACTGKCWHTLNGLRRIVKERIKEERSGIKVSAMRSNKEFMDLQHFLGR